MISSIKSRLALIVRGLLGPEKYGALTFRRHPELGRSWGGPFNAQRGRCLIVAALIGRTSPRFVLETGTYRGTSTEWLSAFQLPIYSIEGMAENFGFARARLAAHPNVTIIKGDSRTQLRALLDGALADRRDEPCLIYLDAHWYEDLPLADELEIVFNGLSQAVVMIDDFQVVDDQGYAFDDYGPGKALTLELVAPAMRRFGLAAYYPAVKAGDETGARRGCLVLVKDGPLRPALDGMAELRAVATGADSQL